jgi:glucose/arabinose dehydrogenase
MGGRPAVPRQRLPVVLGACAAIVLGTGCWSLRGASGGGQTQFHGPRRVDPSDVALPSGYRIEVVATGLTFPTALTFDDAGRAYVVEAGYSYGEAFTTAALRRVEPDGRTTVVASGGNGPWTGVAYHGGAFYVVQGGQTEGGRVVRIALDGRQTTLLEKLPSLGDHHANGPAVGPDGWLYFAQGTATNSGVVGDDNAQFGWLRRHPDFHDVPCRDVTLSGANFETRNALGDGRAVTGAFAPYGTATRPGQIVPGRVPCSGAVMRIPLAGGPPELVAWGLRNPFGLAFAPDGRLFVTENGYDVRGSRPVFGAADHLWVMERGRWYGWPDHSGGERLATARFKPPGKAIPAPVLAALPGVPPEPVARFAVNSSADGLDFSRSDRFGHVGQAFVALFGDMAPNTGKVMAPVGYEVVRVDVSTGAIVPFATNRGETRGPASWLKNGGLERPVAVRFDPGGAALWIVDFGVMTMSERGPRPAAATGVLWRVSRTGSGS